MIKSAAQVTTEMREKALEIVKENFEYALPSFGDAVTAQILTIGMMG